MSNGGPVRRNRCQHTSALPPFGSQSVEIVGPRFTRGYRPAVVPYYSRN